MCTNFQIVHAPDKHSRTDLVVSAQKTDKSGRNISQEAIVHIVRAQQSGGLHCGHQCAYGSRERQTLNVNVEDKQWESLKSNSAT